MSFICMRAKNYFHIKGWALNLVLIQRPGGTRKWPIRAFRPNGKRELEPRDQVFPSIHITFITYTQKISSFTPVLFIRIVRYSFYLLIFYSEKFSPWIWRLSFVVYVTLNLSTYRFRLPQHWPLIDPEECCFRVLCLNKFDGVLVQSPTEQT